jgi:ribosomal protein S18 acetylase RimI-like enzyme
LNNRLSQSKTLASSDTFGASLYTLYMQMLQLAKKSELPEIMSMVSCCIDAMRSSGIDQWDDAYPSESVFGQDIESQHLYTLRGGSLIGCITINDVESPEYSSIRWIYMDSPISVFHRLMVHPDHQGRGYARMIMEQAEALAAKNSTFAIRLDAYMDNAISRRLYQSLGYRAAGEVMFRKGIFICFEKKL